jgi:uncharacterized protein YsxB (DUF464 family)
MIQVTFTPLSVEMKGHAHYAHAGQDIVCAAASAIAISLIQAMNKFVAKQDVILDEEEGYLYFEITKLQPIAVALLLSMKETLQELEAQFPKQIRVKDNPIK